MSNRSIIVASIVALALVSSTQIGVAEEQASEQRQMFVEGARLWPVYCAQCHNARPGSQFSPAQWDAIAMHMKTLSNMPAKDMRAIKEFPKEAR
jgi:mono/diheme cytochrome c family protein